MQTDEEIQYQKNSGVRMLMRPLGYSLFFHALMLGVFIFALTLDLSKPPSKPIIITLTSIVPSSRNTPQLSQPHRITTMQPVQKDYEAPTQPKLQKTPKPPQASATPAPKAPTLTQNSSSSQVIPIVSTSIATRQIEVPKTPTPPAPPPKINPDKAFLEAHLGEIRTLLVQNLKYPKMAQKLRMQGEVRVSFLFNSDGSVEEIKVIESSGFDILDKDAVTLIEKTASRFPKPSESVRISVPLSYVLR